MLKVQDLSVRAGKKQILCGVSFALAAGENLLILGENGSGKTTLFRAMLGLFGAGAQSGAVTLRGRRLGEYSRRELAALVSYIPQSRTSVFDFSAFEVVLMGAFYRTGLLADYTRAQRARAEEVMAGLGILPLKDEPLAHLSGGQRQLVFIARALVQDAPLVFMDEPTTGLDFANQIRFLQLLARLNEMGKNYVLTTHSLRQARYLGGRVLLLQGGRVAAFGDAGAVLGDERLAGIYGEDFAKYADLL